MIDSNNWQWIPIKQSATQPWSLLAVQCYSYAGTFRCLWTSTLRSPRATNLLSSTRPAWRKGMGTTETVLGNIFIVVLVATHQHLPSPVENLSSLEICYASIDLPRLLASFLTVAPPLLRTAMAQLYFFESLVVSKCYLLTTMSYEQYLAVCHLMFYTRMVNWKAFFQLAVGLWHGGTTSSTIITYFSSLLKFCGPNPIDN